MTAQLLNPLTESVDAVLAQASSLEEAEEQEEEEGTHLLSRKVKRCTYVAMFSTQDK